MSKYATPSNLNFLARWQLTNIFHNICLRFVLAGNSNTKNIFLPRWKWDVTVEIAVFTGFSHLSCYLSLTPEKTLFCHFTTFSRSFFHYERFLRGKLQNAFYDQKPKTQTKPEAEAETEESFWHAACLMRVAAQLMTTQPTQLLL